MEKDWPEFVANICKAQKVWYRLSRIMGKEVADWRISGQFYVAFMQATLLLRLETWVVTPPHGAYIGGGNTTGWCGEYYEAPEATAIWGMGVTPNSGCAKGGGDWLVGDIHHTEAEHGGTFHYHPYNHGPLPVR